ncbi:MAG: hypothetical protein ABFS32_21285 [Bacteroidota bacterium]
MSIPLKLLANFMSGFVVLFLFFGAVFSGSYLIMAMIIAITSIAGYVLSRIPSENNKKLFWSYGIAYISVPLLFILSSSDTDTDSSLTMRLTWAGLLIVLYVASLIGGISASRSPQT